MIKERRTPTGIYFADKSKRLNARLQHMLNYLISSLTVVIQKNKKKLMEYQQQETKNSREKSMISYEARKIPHFLWGNLIKGKMVKVMLKSECQHRKEVGQYHLTESIHINCSLKLLVKMRTATISAHHLVSSAFSE